MTERTCLDCGADISDRKRNAKRCKPCQRESKRAKDRARRAANPEKQRAAARRAAARRAANPEKQRAACRAYYAANRERVLERSAAYYVANSERVREVNAAYRAANPEKCQAWRVVNSKKAVAGMKAWRAANPEKAAAMSVAAAHRRRARKLGQLGHVSPDIEALLMDQQGHRCAAPWCRLELGGRKMWHLDHIMPLNLGGMHDDDNLQILCAPCNLSKSAKHPDVWKVENAVNP